MRRFTLTQRLSALVAGLLLTCGAVSVALQMRSSERHAQEVIQRLSLGLAAHIAESQRALLAPAGLNDSAVHELFDKLMAVNPSVEVYLLDVEGRIVAHAAPPGHVKRDRIDLAPVRALLGGAALPVVGDDPRTPSGRNVFSAAPLRIDGRDRGYVYVILAGEAHQALTRSLAPVELLQTTMGSMAVVALLGVLAGLSALRWITRPLRELTDDVRRFEAAGAAATPIRSTPASSSARPRSTMASAPTEGDEIALLRQAFAQLTERVAAQWSELRQQDQQRRELVANISHDLRTPLTSLHGYLETLRLKSGLLSPDERDRYLDIALGQSRKVGALAQSLFELARLEHGGVRPDKEMLALGDLVQDVFQKFELTAEARRQRLVADIAPDLPVVEADVGMIERVLTNLLDNALRHSPVGGEVYVRLRRAPGGIEVTVADSGPGVPPGLRPSLFTRPSMASGAGYGPEVAGGLGLLIVRRILQLHGSDIGLDTTAKAGAVFRFRLHSA